MDRNRWFQRNAHRRLNRVLRPDSVVIAYSYAARDLLRLANQIGCHTILGQIDPGIVEERLVAEEVAAHPKVASGFKPAPTEYWDLWRKECELADRIMVNSRWSADALAQDGVPSDKIRIVPLAYEFPPADPAFRRTFPSSFTAARPLRALFLGQVIPRKGILRLLEAADLLQSEPVEFIVVGDPGLLTEQLRRRPNIRAVGAVPRDVVDRYYQQADLFLFPTLSDGFGLTQLEARRWNLPLICSNRCGEVVIHERTGLQLSDVTAESIADALRRVLASPQLLEQWSQPASEAERFSLEQLGRNLANIEDELRGE